MKKALLPVGSFIVVIVIVTAIFIINDQTPAKAKKPSEKYTGVTSEVEAEYDLEGAALVKPADNKNDHKIEVGDETLEDFSPELHLKKWDNQAGFKVKYRDVTGGDKNAKVKFNGKKIKYEDGDQEAHFYSIDPNADYPDGAYEMEIEYKAEPVSNVVTLDIEIDDLELYYQPALDTAGDPEADHCTDTQCFDAENNVITERSENVIGSYAVYHASESGDYTASGGYNYQTGKLFHIYRPKITDKDGDWVWGELNINTNTNELTITIDQTWLDNAKYPIVVDPTFGYGTKGATSKVITAYMYASEFFPSSNGDVTSISMYISNILSLTGLKLGIYDASFNALGSGEILSFTNSTFNEVTLSSSVAVTSGSGYYLAGLGNGSNALCYYDTDTVNAAADSVVDSPYASFPQNPWTPALTYTDRKFSIYATYTEGTPTSRRLIITN